MQKVAIIVALVGSMFFTAPYLVGEKTVSFKQEPKSTIQESQATPVKVAPSQGLTAKAEKIEIKNNLKNLVLEKKNMVVFRGPVTEKSVSQVILKLKDMSQKLSKTDEIYLVLDTPGGSIFAGLDLIDYAQSLPQKVNTVSLFAASMGFQFAQSLDKRYITKTGILMSHRAAGGVSGQFDGELEVRYKMIRRAIDMLDTVASDRMETSIEDYRKLVLNEYWVFGIDAVQEKAADEQIVASCGASLSGTEDEEILTIFGVIKLTWSECPLVKYPLAINFQNIRGTKAQVASVKKYTNTLIKNKRAFIDDYIKNEKYLTIQK